MKKETKDALKESWIPVSTIVLIWMLAWFVFMLQGCCSYNADNHFETDALKEQIAHQNEIIGTYEQFRTTAVQIYMEQVDSTGDGYDGSDQGVKFWSESSKIDSLVNSLGND